MPDQTENYLFNMGIEGDDALQTLRAILAQMRELNRAGGEMLGELRNISQAMGAFSEDADRATEAVREKTQATREATSASTQHASATAAEAAALDTAAQSARQYNEAMQSRTRTGGGEEPPPLRPGDYDEFHERYQTLARQKWIQQEHMANVEDQASQEVSARQRLVNTLSAIERQREGEDQAALRKQYQWMETQRRANLERYERQRQDRPITERERTMQQEWQRTGRQPEFDPTETDELRDAMEHPFRRHVRWFIEGTVIYMALSTAINAVRTVLQQLVSVTEAQSRAQAELNLNMGMSVEQTRRLQQVTRAPLQAAGIGATEAAPFYIESGRFADTEQDLVRTTEASATLANITGMDPVQSVQAVQGILGQYQMELRDVAEITDALAYAQRTGSDTAEQYAQALARSGAALRTGGYDLRESVALLTGLTQVVSRSGTELGMFLQQIFTMTEAKSGRLREVGIEPTGKDPKEILEEAARRFPDMDEAQQRRTIIGIGGTRFMAETRALLENYEMINASIEKMGDLEGEAARMVETRASAVEGANNRAAAAWENYLRHASEAVRLEERLVGFARMREQMLTAPVVRTEVEEMLPEDRMALVQRMRQELELTHMQQERLRQVETQGIEGVSSRMMIQQTITELDPDQLAIISRWQREIEEARPQFPLMMHGRGMQDEHPAIVPMREEEEGLAPLLLLSMERFSQVQADEFQGNINRITQSFEDAGYSLGEDVTRQIIVGEGEDFQLREISGAATAMEMYLREIRDQGRQLEGVWNLPGPGMVPLESIFRRQFESGGLDEPEYRADLPLVFGGEAEAESQRLELPMMYHEDRALTPPISGPERESRRLELPMMYHEDQTLTPPISGPTVHSAPEVEEPLRLELPMIFRGLQGAEATQKLAERGKGAVDILENKIYLNEKVIAETTSVIMGDDLDRTIMAGGTYGSNLMSAVM